MDKLSKDEMETAFQESESWQVPLTEKGQDLQEQRRHGFFKGYAYNVGDKGWSSGDIESFAYRLTEFLNPLLPPEKNMGNFFDTDDKYLPLVEFLHEELGSYKNKRRIIIKWKRITNKNGKGLKS